MKKKSRIRIVFLIVFTMILAMGMTAFAMEPSIIIPSSDSIAEDVYEEIVIDEEIPRDTEKEEAVDEEKEEVVDEEKEEAVDEEKEEAVDEEKEEAVDEEKEEAVDEEKEEAVDEEKEEAVDEEKEEVVDVKLKIHHILLEGDLGEFVEEFYDFDVGDNIRGSDFAIQEENLIFVGSSPEEFEIVNGENIIKLYYQLEDESGYKSESSDFPEGEGREIKSPYIEEFIEGSLGPFLGVNRINHKNLRLMNQEFYLDEINNKIWPEPGSLNINKTGQAVEGSGNQWDILLEIQGKNLKKTTDIVLVIDRSGSMQGERIQNAKIAAKAFVNNLLVDETNDNVRIAIVSFASDVSINANFQGYLNKQTLINAIDGISAVGGTHIQAGLRQADALLNGSTADYKNIVLLGDGAATFSYAITNPNDYLEFWYTSGTGTFFNPYRYHYRTTSNVPQSQFNYSSTVGNGSSDHFEYASSGSNRYNYRHGASSVAEAGFTRAKGNIIYSIALGAGTEGEWTLENIADSGNYYVTSSPQALEPIFNEIAGRIAFAATNAVVTDPLGDMYSILGINSSNYNDLIEISHGTLIYDTSTDTISWNIGTINEGVNYWMRYTVTLDYSAEGGVFYPANKPTYIDYINIDGDMAKKYFPIPEFRLRSLIITKFIENSSYPNQEFDIVLEGPTGPYSKIFTISIKDGESKTIKGLLPGSYTLKEIIPMNYDLEGMSGGNTSNISGNTYSLNILENDWNVAITVTNKRTNDGWFYDDDERENNFSVGIITVVSRIILEDEFKIEELMVYGDKSKVIKIG